MYFENVKIFEANLATLVAILGVSIFIYAIIMWRKNLKTVKNYFDTLPKTVDEIPKHHYFSKWMPRIVEGLWTSFLLRQGGARALQDLAVSCGNIFETTMYTKRVTVVSDATLVQV